MKLSLQNVSKNFETKEQKKLGAVSEFSLTVEDGTLVCLLGPSGCGKSTLLNMICGLENVTAGKIFFDDTDVTNLPAEHRGVGMVFQNYALYPHLNVRDNIRFPLQNLKGKDKLSKEEIDARTEQAAELVQVSSLMNRKPANMSGGQQQRVAIARALVKRPKILLLDEPLSNLDARLRIQMREEIRRIQRETGITTVFVTHDQEEAMSISDSIVLMKEGVVQQIGKPQEVYDCPKNLFVAKFLGTPPINIYTGEIRGGQLFVGENALFSVKNCAEGAVTVGIRPEGYIPCENGSLVCNFHSLEVMGRDTSIVATHPACAGNFRAIVSADAVSTLKGNTVRFNVRPNKVYLFDTKTEERVMYEQ